MKRERQSSWPVAAAAQRRTDNELVEVRVRVRCSRAAANEDAADAPTADEADVRAPEQEYEYDSRVLHVSGRRRLFVRLGNNISAATSDVRRETREQLGPRAARRSETWRGAAPHENTEQ